MDREYFCIGTVKGDLHDIGKNLVIMMIESTGYEVVDLGIDVPVERFVEAANDPEITVMGVSALVMVILGLAMKKWKWLGDYALPISLVLGMISAIPITALLG